MLAKGALWEGGQGQLAQDWLKWMADNGPPGGHWPQVRLTSGTKGRDFKHYGSLWRRNMTQWDIYVERGHTDIFELERRLRSHPWVKPHTLHRKPPKPIPDHHVAKNPLAPKPYGPHESPHDLVFQSVDNTKHDFGYTSNDDILRPINEATLRTSPACGGGGGFVQICHVWIKCSSNIDSESEHAMLDVMLNVADFASGFSRYGIVKPVTQWWNGKWQPVAPDFRPPMGFHTGPAVPPAQWVPKAQLPQPTPQRMIGPAPAHPKRAGGRTERAGGRAAPRGRAGAESGAPGAEPGAWPGAWPGTWPGVSICYLFYFNFMRPSRGAEPGGRAGSRGGGPGRRAERRVMQ